MLCTVPLNSINYCLVFQSKCLQYPILAEFFQELDASPSYLISVEFKTQTTQTEQSQ